MSEVPLVQVKYHAFHWSLFLSGCIFLCEGIIGAIFCNEGLLFFIFAFPTFMWVGALPLLVGLLFILQALLQQESITLAQTTNSVVLGRKKWRNVIKSFHRKEIGYVSLQYHEAKTKRWVIVFVLLLHAIEVLFRNGVDLLGIAPLAPFLLLNALLTMIGVGIFIVFPRRFLEIGTQTEFAAVPWPSRDKDENMRSNLFTLFGLDPTSVQESKSHPIRENFQEDYSSFILALVLIVGGLLLAVMPAWFYGQFTAPLSLALGGKMLLRILKGGKYHNQVQEGSTFFGLSMHLTFVHGTISSIEKRDLVSLSNFHPLELLGFIYLISQSVKYGFRFVWWPYMGFNLAYFALGMTFITLIFIKLLIPAHQVRSQISGFPLILRNSLSADQKLVSRNLLAPIKVKIQDFLNSFHTHKAEKSFLFVFAFFIITVVASCIYFAYGGSSLLL